MSIFDEISDFERRLDPDAPMSPPTGNVRPKSRPIRGMPEPLKKPEQKSPTRGPATPPTPTPSPIPGEPGNPMGFDPSMLPETPDRSTREQPKGGPHPMNPAVLAQRKTVASQPAQQDSGAGGFDSFMEFVTGEKRGSQKSPDGGQDDAGMLSLIYEGLMGGSLVRQGKDMLEGEQTSGTAGAGAMLDWGFMGGFDALAAADNAAAEWLKNGADFSETYADTQNDINARLAENRIEYGGSTTVGSILGGVGAAIGPGMLADKAMRGAGWLTRALTVTPATASGEAALYRYNSDGTKEEIMRDARNAAIWSVVLGGPTAFVGNRIRNLRGKNSTNSERMAGQELLNAINAKQNERGLPKMTPDQFAQAAKERGFDAVMGDYYPEMQGLMSSALAEGSSEGAKKVLAVLSRRNDIETSFPQVIDDVVNVPRARSVKSFKANVKKRHESLRPKYDAVFKEMDGVRFNRAGMTRSLIESFEDMPIDGVDRKQIKKAINDFRELVKARTGAKGREITARELHGVKQEFYKRNSRNPAGERVYSQINAWIAERNDEYGKLSKTYATALKEQNAYEDGYRYFTGKKEDAGDVVERMGSLGTYAEAHAFATGARRKLVEDLNGKSPNGVLNYFKNNAHSIDKLKQVLGPERTDKLLGAVMAETASEQLRLTLNKASRQFSDPKTGRQKRQAVVDALISSMGRGRSPGRLRALFNTLVPEDISEPKNVTNLYGQFAAAPLEDQPKLMRQLEAIAKGGLPNARGTRATMLGGGVAGGLAPAETIRDYLGSADNPIDLNMEEPIDMQNE